MPTHSGLAQPVSNEPSTNTSTTDNDSASDKALVIIGAGLAGCALAHTLASKGQRVTVLDSASEAASAASGNTAALLRPHITREGNLASRFSASGFLETLSVLKTLEASNKPGKRPVFHTCGALHLLERSDDYPEHPLYRHVSKQSARTLTGYPLATGGLYYPDACYVNVPVLCQLLLQHPRIDFITGIQVHSIDRVANQWQINSDKTNYQASRVVLANGTGISSFNAMQELTLQPVRGQTTRIEAPCPKLTVAVCGSHTVIPLQTDSKDQSQQLQQTQQWQISATYDRQSSNATTDHADDVANLTAAEQSLNSKDVFTAAKRTNTDPTTACSDIESHWAGVRATTPDRLPVVGHLPDFTFYHMHYHDLHHGKPEALYPDAQYQPGLYVLGGLGSRGLSVAFIAARLLAAQILGKNTGSTDDSLYTLLHPARFLIRRSKRRLSTPRPG